MIWYVWSPDFEEEFAQAAQIEAPDHTAAALEWARLDCDERYLAAYTYFSAEGVTVCVTDSNMSPPFRLCVIATLVASAIDEEPGP